MAEQEGLGSVIDKIALWLHGVNRAVHDWLSGFFGGGPLGDVWATVIQFFVIAAFFAWVLLLIRQWMVDDTREYRRNRTERDEARQARNPEE